VAKIFIDTNILVYSLDNSNRKKKAKAREILTKLKLNDTPVISTQVLQEVYYTLTGKIKIDKAVAKNIIHDYRNMEVIVNTCDTIEEAIDISISSRLSFWDALIIASAEAANCSAVYSEDLNDSQIIRGVQVINPFNIKNT
jgi:predicted nucleic acid-binding protein